MQPLLRPFDSTDPTYTKEGFLNAIPANFVMNAGREHVESPYHKPWILKRFAMIRTALIGLHNSCIHIYHFKSRRFGMLFAENFERHLITNNRHAGHQRHFSFTFDTAGAFPSGTTARL